MTPAELAKKTGTNERQIREWLANQAAGGYISYDPSTGRYTLPNEHAYALANENSPVYLQGFFQIVKSLFKDESKIVEAIKTGKGLDWGDHDASLFEGTESSFRSNYLGSLTTSWIPALEGMEEQLKKGARVAEVGCGHGAATILMAKAYPNSTFIGFDYHKPSIERAREQAEKEGVSNRAKFEVAKSTDFPDNDYDLIVFFDCLHDMGDPAGASAHALKSLKQKEGTCMIVEPFAEEKLEDNLNPDGRISYAFSTAICVPTSLAQNGPALGAQASEASLKEIITSAGFSRFRRAAQTPFNRVFEARP